MGKNYQIAVIAGDGIGKEVVPEGQRVVEAAARRFGFSVDWTEFDWNCDYYARHGRMMPEDGVEQVRGADAIFLGAVGWPTVPDHISTWDLILKLRRELGLYVALRPARLLKGIVSPLAGRTAKDIDLVIVRENSEGEYSAAGGILYEGTSEEMVIQESVFSKRAIDRILRYAFDLARTRRKKVSLATKSNGVKIAMPYWDARFAEIAREYPDVAHDKFHIDILTAHFVVHPDWFDVVVGSTCSATSCRILAPPWQAALALRRQAISTRREPTRPCSSPSMAPLRTLPDRASPIRSARSGRGR